MALPNHDSCLELAFPQRMNRQREIDSGGTCKENKIVRVLVQYSTIPTIYIPWFISLFKRKRDNYHFSWVKKNALFHGFYFFPHFNTSNYGVDLTISVILWSYNWQYFFFLELHKKMHHLKMDDVLKVHEIPWYPLKVRYASEVRSNTKEEKILLSLSIDT